MAAPTFEKAFFEAEEFLGFRTMSLPHLDTDTRQ